MTKCNDLASITFLIAWEIWNKRNARVFKNKQTPPPVILQKITREARLWVLTAAKCLRNMMPGE
jgi:hypothetical protein